MAAQINIGDAQAVQIDDTGRSIGIFCKNLPLVVSHDLIRELKELSVKNGKKNLRLCLHESPAALFHEMIILEYRGSYFPPHRHLLKGESWHIIEGRMAAVVYDENGTVRDATVLTPNENFLYRVGTNVYHQVIPLSELVIYHEAKPGPFIRESDSQFPPWAPGAANEAELQAYTKKLLQQLAIQ